MTSSGTYNFNLSMAEAGLDAFERCGKRGPEIRTAEHMSSLARSANLVMVEFENVGVNLWEIDLQTIPLVQGQATYTPDPTTILMLDTYITTTQDGQSNDRIIFPISRTDYASFTNKDLQGTTTVFWFDRTIQPTIKLWEVPDADDTYTLKFYRMRQTQDANILLNQTPDLPRRYLNAFVAKLAEFLAEKWAPDRLQTLAQRADVAWKRAFVADRENVDVMITPDVSGYYRR